MKQKQSAKKRRVIYRELLTRYANYNKGKRLAMRWWLLARNR